MQNKLEELIKVSKEIKKLQALEKEIKAWILSDDDFSKEKINGYVVNKITKRIVKVKKDIDLDALYEIYPDAKKVVTSVDMKVLQNIPEAHDMLEIAESSYIMVKEEAIKDDSF